MGVEKFCPNSKFPDKRMYGLTRLDCTCINQKTPLPLFVFTTPLTSSVDTAEQSREQLDTPGPNHGVIDGARLLPTLDHALAQHGTTEHIEQLQNSQDPIAQHEIGQELVAVRAAVIKKNHQVEHELIGRVIAHRGDRIADLLDEFDARQVAVIAVKYVEFVRVFLNGSGEFAHEPV